jgi:hypothetical protein
MRYINFKLIVFLAFLLQINKTTAQFIPCERSYTVFFNPLLQKIKGFSEYNDKITISKSSDILPLNGTSFASNLQELTKHNGKIYILLYQTGFIFQMSEPQGDSVVFTKIDNTITTQQITNNYKICSFVKDKEVYINHKYKNQLNIDKQLHDKIIENGLLFDETDVIKALDVFCQRFSINHNLNIDDFIEDINSGYLLSPRKQLTRKLHQQMTLLKFIKSLLTNKHNMWCIAHKPRSGKSILILLICKYLLENGYKKILIMTSVKDTISSFIKDLEKWVDFKNINYKLQEEVDTIDETFNGILFCSVQYLKKDTQRGDNHAAR